MTKLDLDAIEARANAASAGPWVLKDGEPDIEMLEFNDMCAHNSDATWEQAKADYLFAAHARTDVPAMAAKIRELQELIDSLTYVRLGGPPECLVCSVFRCADPTGKVVGRHKHDCAIAIARDLPRREGP